MYAFMLDKASIRLQKKLGSMYMAMMFKNTCWGIHKRYCSLFFFAIFLCLVCSSCFCLTQFFQDLSFCFAYDVDSIVVIGSVALTVMMPFLHLSLLLLFQYCFHEDWTMKKIIMSFILIIC